MSIIPIIILNIFLSIEIYLVICIYSISYLEKRYSKKHDHFSFYVSFHINFPIILSYPIKAILHKKYDMKYKYMYLSEKIKGEKFSKPSDEEIISLTKELNILERKLKLKKII